MIIRFTSRCPICKNEKLERVHRAWWMRILPGTRFYRCPTCNIYVLHLFSAIAVGKQPF
jgi:hypothetical protein